MIFNSEEQFQRIHRLIQRLREDPRWTDRVTDPRNWLQFGAKELHRTNEQQVQYYADSAGKSSGQKAKLAYTILASAIADQYQIHTSESHGRSFRFIAVDEAFSKSDEANARYAMNLFKQLQLQVLVVTPLDKINVAEPYIRSIHLVRSNPETNRADIISMTIEEYGERRGATPQPEFAE